tara:strand:- start:201 stop:626 length:426 start_codon:yes stop_codon:yes gene_type:complete
LSEALEDILKRHELCEGPLLPILHDVQNTFGYVSDYHMRMIAAGLNITRAEVWGVVSFYHDFRTEPAGKPVLKLCRAEACKARGVEALVEGAEKAAGSRVRIEPVYCLGLCSGGPAAMTPQGDVHARLDSEKLNQLIGSLS